MTGALIPILVVAAIVSLGAGAFIGELMAQRLASGQRMIVAVGLYITLGCLVFTGADIAGIATNVAAHADQPGTVLGFIFVRQIAVMGLLIGASLFLVQRRRLAQGFGLVVSAVIGLPLLTNIWIGAGMTYAFSA